MDDRQAPAVDGTDIGPWEPEPWEQSCKAVVRAVIEVMSEDRKVTLKEFEAICRRHGLTRMRTGRMAYGQLPVRYANFPEARNDN